MGELANESGSGRPNPALITDLALVADRLATANSVDATWCVYSTVDDTLYPVANGWVDNAWDTQRRRGERPTSRTTWSV